MNDKLTDDELSNLQNFLDTPGLGDTSMDVAIMEGYFAALAAGPHAVLPSQWLPWVWDMDAGAVQPPFADVGEANAWMQVIFRQYNGVVRDLMETPAAFRPIYERDPRWSALAWCQGFLFGVELGEDDWAPLLESQPTWMTPFTRLGTDDGLALTEKHGDAEVWLEQILPSLLKIHEYGRKQREAVSGGTVQDTFPFGTRMPGSPTRTAPKVGRNDPCPCGSGMKFKKCCAITSPALY